MVLRVDRQRLAMHSDFPRKLDDLVDRARDRIRVDDAHEKLIRLRYHESPRTTRRWVAESRHWWQHEHGRLRWPRMSEPGLGTTVRLWRRAGCRRAPNDGAAGNAQVGSTAPSPRDTPDAFDPPGYRPAAPVRFPRQVSSDVSRTFSSTVPAGGDRFGPRP